MLRGLPAGFRVAAKRLMRRKGVVGVFWGSPEPRGDGPARLRVHVREKLAPTELSTQQVIGDRVAGLRTRVVGVGEPRGHVITAKDLVRASEDSRLSTLTGLAYDGATWFALVCGHGALPINAGAIVTSYQRAGDTYGRRVKDVSSGMEFEAELVAGRIGPTQDWAVLQLAMPDQPVDAACAVTGTRRPPLRTSLIQRNEAVRQYSALDRTTRGGRTNGRIVNGTVTAYGQVRLLMYDRNWYLYTSVLEVHGEDEPFSREGDSGSLVADEQGHAVGIVLGADQDDSHPDRSSYVLPFLSPIGLNLPHLERFFASAGGTP